MLREYAALAPPVANDPGMPLTELANLWGVPRTTAALRVQKLVAAGQLRVGQRRGVIARGHSCLMRVYAIVPQPKPKGAKGQE